MRAERGGNRIVSIHAPRMRGDTSPTRSPTASICFNPRPSHEGRLKRGSGGWGRAGVSIHAPRMRGDASVPGSKDNWEMFQSTPLA